MSEEEKSKAKSFDEDGNKKLVDMWTLLEPLRNHEGSAPLVKCAGHWLSARWLYAWPFVYDMNFRKDDVTLFSYPKSGNNWLYYILHLILTECDEATQQGYFPWHLEAISIPPTKEAYDDLEKAPSPRIFTSHLPVAMLPLNVFNGRVIYLYRNAKDVAVSLFHMLKSMAPIESWEYKKTFEEFVNDFIDGEVLVGPQHKHVRDYFELAKSSNKQILLVSYEDLKQNPTEQIHRMATFLGKQLADGTVSKIIDLTSAQKMRKNDEVNWATFKAIGFYKEDKEFIRKATVGDWRSHFTNKELLERFDHLIRTTYPPGLNDPNV